MSKQLEEERKILAMTGEEAQIAKLKVMGLTEAQVANARGLLQMNEAVKAQRQLKEETDALTNSLKQEIDTFRMSSDEKRIHALAAKGATDAQLAEAKLLAQAKKGLEERKKLEDEAKALTKELNPFESFKEEAEKLNKMLDAGLITQETYGLAMEKLEKKLDDAQNGARKAREEVQKFDAALAGSAEAQFRIAQYIDRISMQTGDAVRTQDEAKRRQAERQPMADKQAGGGKEDGKVAAGIDKVANILIQIRDKGAVGLAAAVMEG